MAAEPPPKRSSGQSTGPFFVTSESLTYNTFASVVVSSEKRGGSASDSFPMGVPVVQNTLADLSKRPTPSLLREGRSQKQPTPLLQPAYTTPFMSSHVSALKAPSAAGTGVYKAHRFLHDVLRTEEARFVSTLDDLRFKQARAERSAAIRIQSSWRIFAVLRAKAASASSPGKTAARARASTAVRQQMWDLLAQDQRCSGWAFSARQRQRLDEAEAAMAAQAQQLHLRSRLTSKKSKQGAAHMGKETAAACVLQRTIRAKHARAKVKHLKRAKYGDAYVEDENDESASDAAVAALLGRSLSTNDNDEPTSSSSTNAGSSGGGSPTNKGANRKSRLQAKRKGAAQADANSLMADIDSWAASQADHNHKQKPTRHEAKLEASAEMIEARRLEALANKAVVRKPKPKVVLPNKQGGLFAAAPVVASTSLV